jgi:hypothetical protein
MMYGLVFVPQIRVAEVFRMVILEYVSEQKDNEYFQDFEEQIEDSSAIIRRPALGPFLRQ